ncbi:hypothetical protein MNV49_006909 [Pseudohyphozyma bogoriensis]|nr:hypothetical protein MNV49_006909 [Pseudohyphozyma bogoriensis]
MAAVCPAPVAALVQPTSARLHYLLSGTFNTIFLYLLAFDPATASLTIHAKIRGEGPHQFWALNEERTRAYGTTWAKEPTLTATSSYIQVSPFQPRIYSAGGPTGEVHEVDPATGGFGKKLQELLYVPEDELEAADKTRVALRYGSHAIDISLPRKKVFAPHVGSDTIYMYDLEENGTLKLLAKCPSFGDEHEGPRHTIPSPDGTKLYAVTEHTSYIDVYNINADSLTHVQRVSVIPPEKYSLRKSFRGDTLRFSQDGRFLYGTTRGMTAATRGYVAVWEIAADGTLGTGSPLAEPVDSFETGTSGGKANAVEAFPFHPEGQAIARDWVALTDDQDGWVWILEWDGKKLSEIAGVRLGEGEEGEEAGVGASHAVWLS